MVVTISVIIPTYNYARFITDAIDSVLEQTLSPDEIIVVDDGSTDNTEKVLERFGDKIIFIKQENAGVCAARNCGVAASSGEFIAFMDADDIWHPTKLEKQMAKFAEDSDIGLVHCGMREFDNDTGKTLQIHIEGKEGFILKDMVLWEGPAIIGPGGTILITRKVFDDVGGFGFELTNGEDWEFCVRVASKYKVGFVSEILVDYRNHGINAHRDVVKMERSTLKAWGKVFDGSNKEIMQFKRRSYGNLHKVLAGSFLHSANYPSFFKNFIKSLWYRPSFLKYYISLLIKPKNSDPQ